MPMPRSTIALSVLLLIIAFGTVGHLQAQSDDTAAIDTYVAEQMQAWNIPGLALAIVRGDVIAYMQSYGTADASGRAVTPQSPFYLASVSKSFTATAIMQLVEAGSIDLEAPVQQYISWFREGMNDPMPITVRQLLNQNSGFSTYSGLERINDGDLSDTALENNVRRLSASPLRDAPGASFEYSNSNYDILGYLVQVVSGQPYEAYIAERIFAPLAMEHSYAVLSEAQQNGLAEGFYQFFGRPTAMPLPYSRAIAPSSGLMSSAEDLAHYTIAHLNDGRYGEESILSPESIDQLHEPGISTDLYNSYAMGWFVGPLWEALQRDTDTDTYKVPVSIQHDGDWSTFRSFITLVPQDNLGVIVLINTADYARDSAYWGVSHNLVLMALGSQPVAIPIYEDLFTQYSRWIAILVMAIWIVRLIMSIRQLRRWQRSPESRPHTAAAKFRTIVLPILIDLVLVVYMGFGIPMQFEAPLTTILRSTPDIAILMVIALLLAVGYGLIRTLLYLRTLSRTQTQN